MSEYLKSLKHRSTQKLGIRPVISLWPHFLGYLESFSHTRLPVHRVVSNHTAIPEEPSSLHKSRQAAEMPKKISPVEDEWFGVPDPKKRKQIQDRLAQRARRKYPSLQFDIWASYRSVWLFMYSFSIHRYKTGQFSEEALQTMLQPLNDTIAKSFTGCDISQFPSRSGR
jgi:hypothetical protein